MAITTMISLTMMITMITLTAKCEFLHSHQTDVDASVYTLLKKWSEQSTHDVKRLTVVFDDYEGKENILEFPRYIFQALNTSTSLMSVKYLMSHDIKNKTLDYDVIVPGSCVLLLSSNILRIRHILKSPYLNSFWHAENLYILQETKYGITTTYDDVRHRFLEWALERLWTYRRVYKIVVCIGDKLIHYDPFKHENHLDRKTSDQICVSNCTEMKRATILSVNNVNRIEFSRYLYEHKERFDGYPLKISIFNSPTMVKTQNTYSGLDFNYLEEVCKRMNVTPIFVHSKDKYGWQENGKFFGTLGHIVYKHADVTFNQFFVKHYSTRQVENTIAISSDKLCVLVPRAAPIPEYLVIVRTFTISSWILIFLGHMVIATIYTFMKRKQKKVTSKGKRFETVCELGMYAQNEHVCVNFPVTRYRFQDQRVAFNDFSRTTRKGYSTTEKHRTIDDIEENLYYYSKEIRRKESNGFRELGLTYLVSCGKYTTRIILQTMQPFDVAGPQMSERLLIISSLIMSLILNGVLTSKLTSSFTKLSFFEDIHTLKDLAESGLTILTESPDIIEDALSDQDSTVMKRLRMKMQYANETEVRRRLFETKDAGFLQRQAVISLKFNEYQRKKIHVVEECPRVYILSHLIMAGSPFATRINSILGRLNNGGFYEHWFKGMFLSSEQTSQEENTDVRLKLTMKHFVIPFGILAVGLVTSTVVFAYERRHYNLRKL